MEATAPRTTKARTQSVREFSLFGLDRTFIAPLPRKIWIPSITQEGAIFLKQKQNILSIKDPLQLSKKPKLVGAGVVATKLIIRILKI